MSKLENKSSVEPLKSCDLLEDAIFTQHLSPNTKFCIVDEYDSILIKFVNTKFCGLGYMYFTKEEFVSLM